ncbi:MAG: hypothetical protein J6B04_05620 [Clostridia bacterium]|nr:hypothetical protein [Clostridia bacterium]
MPNYSKKNSKSYIVGVVALLVALALVFTYVFTSIGTGSWNPVDWVKDDQQVEELPDANGGTVVDEGNVTTNGVGLKIRKVSAMNDMVTGDPVSQDLEDTYELTASVEPAGAKATYVWSIAWKDEASEFATGKTVTDYATLTPTADGAATAILQGLSDFGEQILVTVSTQENESISATCTVDYAKRIVDYKVTYKQATISGSPFYGDPVVYTKDNTHVVLDGSKYFDLEFSKVEPVYSNYTIDDTFTETSSFTANSDIAEGLSGATGVTVTANNKDTATMSILSYNAYSILNNSGVFTAKSSNAMAFASAANNYLVNNVTTNDIMGTFNFTLTGTYSTYTCTYTFAVNYSGVDILPTAITVNPGSIIL